MKPEENLIAGGTTNATAIDIATSDDDDDDGGGGGGSSSDIEVVQVVPSPRRSGRARCSTTIEIDGHTVLKENNYIVKGDEYIFGDNVTTQPKRPPAKQKNHNPRQPPPPPPRRPPRQIKSYEIARQQHNDTVRTSKDQKQIRRLGFLVSHIDKLKPFCRPAILEQLQHDYHHHHHHHHHHRRLMMSKKNKSTTTTTTLQSSEQPQQLPMVTNQPTDITATLRDYQLQGLQFMVQMHHQNLAMILGDEMGLGKTLQTISLLTYLKQHHQMTGPSLIICPLSVLSSWCHEISKWNPSFRYFRLHASNTEEQLHQKHELLTNATAYDMIVTTYEMAKLPLLQSVYSRYSFNYVVLDEGHKIKGHQTQIAQAVRNIHSQNTLLLTGTPLQNNLVELWSLLNYLYPTVFTIVEPWEQAFNLKDNIVDKSFLRDAQQLLELFMLRRLKSQVETKIPPKLETKVYCPLSKTQVFWYKSLLMKDLGGLAAQQEDYEQPPQNGHSPQQQQTAAAAITNTTATNTKFKNRHALLKSLFMQLRKCCNHPFMFEGAEVNPDDTSLEDLIAASGKLSVLDMLLRSLFLRNHRTVLFSQFTQVLDIIEDYCVLRGWKYCRLDGTTDRAKRNYYIRRFNEQPQSPYFLFLVSTRSGGMGLNLQTADTCILYDSDWNPQQDIQAMGRVHRIGQTKTVHVYRLVSSGTIEERMMERAEKKLLLEVVNRESSSSNNSPEHPNKKDDDSPGQEENNVRGLSSKELFDDIQFGSEAVFGTNTNHALPTWKEIQTITDRSRKESESTGKLKGGVRKSAKEFNAQQEYTQTRVFGGKDFRAICFEQEQQQKKAIPKNLSGIGELWAEISKLSGQKRQRQKRVVMVEGTGSGYGSKCVPVLASNNYELQEGESSVFRRELSQTNRNAFAVQKRKSSKVDLLDNFGICQICGDGGSLVCCPRCPCSVHLDCVGLTSAKELLNCTHHHCVGCKKNRASAGGLLYPCHACWKSYCEDCLPTEGVTFLDRVERYDKCGYDSGSGKVIYINCSDECEAYAKSTLGYNPSRLTNKTNSSQECPKHLNVSFNFGDTIDLDEQQEQVEKAQMDELTSRTRSSRQTRSASAKHRSTSSHITPSPKRVKAAAEQQQHKEN